MVHRQSNKSSKILKREKVSRLIENVIVDINKQIEAYENDIGTDRTLVQLKKILAEVLKMKEVMSATKYKPQYPKVICDSWDYQFELGSKLINLAHEYEKLD